MTSLELIASAIATQEGFFDLKPNASQLNNNPGNLRASPLKRLPGVKGFPKFLSKEEGIAAIVHQIALFAVRGLTLRQVIQTWAPPSGADGGNDTNAYIKNVALRTGLDLDVPIWTFLSISKL